MGQQGLWPDVIPDLEVSIDSDGMACVDTGRGRIFSGTGIAAAIWLSASRGQSREETAREISARFNLAPQQASHGIQAFLDSLERLGLTRRAGAKR